jgi:hypothetical protein
VSSLAKKILLCLLPAALAFGAGPQFSSDKPVVNFRLPWFTPDGYREWMIRGSEARYANENRIGIKDLTLTIFSGQADEKVDTLILSPNAVVHPNESVVTGSTTIRIINDQFEASGTDWHFNQLGKRNFKVSMGKNTRVTFQAEFKDFLK